MTILKLFLCLVLSVAFAKSHRKAKSKKAAASKIHMTKVGSCAIAPPAEGAEPPENVKTVLIIKQWHLPPTTTTKGFKEKYPQEKNQTAIYQFLEEGTKKQDLQLIVSEGCEGEINSEFKEVFNGWDYNSLKAQSKQKGYDKIITLAPLKVEAKYGDKIETFCGDNDGLIKEGNLRLSNLRGWMGFYGRLNETKGDPEKAKLYTESATELLKIPKDTPAEKLMTDVKEKIKEELTAFQKSLNDRNDSFVKTLQDHDFTKAAVVIGGLHAEDLREKLEKAGIGCEVLEPPGYQKDDEKLIRDFESALN